MNGLAMARDMAQRSVIIKLKRPTYSGDWEAELQAFIEAHRWEIVADIAAFFAGPVYPLEKHTRWGLWERDILARLPEPADIQRTILDRQSIVDVDEDEAGEFEDYIACELERLGYDPESEWVFIPGFVAREWMMKARGERMTTTAVTRMVNQWSNEGTAMAIKVNPSRKNGRGLLWAKCPRPPFTCTDLEERQRQQVNSQSWVR